MPRSEDRGAALVHNAISLIAGIAFGFLGGLQTYSARVATIETKVTVIYSALEARGWIAAPKAAALDGGEVAR